MPLNCKTSSWTEEMQLFSFVSCKRIPPVHVLNERHWGSSTQSIYKRATIIQLSCTNGYAEGMSFVYYTSAWMQTTIASFTDAKYSLLNPIAYLNTAWRIFRKPVQELLVKIAVFSNLLVFIISMLAMKVWVKCQIRREWSCNIVNNRVIVVPQLDDAFVLMLNVEDEPSNTFLQCKFSIIRR